MKIKCLCLSIFILTHTVSCSPFSPLEFPNTETTDSTKPQFKKLSIFATRGALTAQEFEHFVVEDDLYFEECGSLQETNDTSTSELQLQVGRFRIARSEKDLRILRAQDISIPQGLFAEAFAGTAPGATAESAITSIDSKGMIEIVATLADGSTQTHLSSFDSIAEPETTLERKLLTLYRSVRGAKCR